MPHGCKRSGGFVDSECTAACDCHVTLAMDKAKAKYIAPISEGELAIRMAEAAIGMKRPAGKSVDECLASFPADWGQAFQRAARAAMTYWGECIDGANQPS